MTAYAVCRSFTTPSGRKVQEFASLDGIHPAAAYAGVRWSTDLKWVAWCVARSFGPDWRVVPVDAATGRVVRS